MNMKGRLKHISHEHPLLSFEAIEDDSSYICNGCGKGLHGSCYVCNTCYPSFLFVLHKSCFEVAHSHEVQHPIHDKHPLIICKTPPYDKETCTCNICGEPCMRFIVYHCPLCKIYVHFRCLSLPLSIETKIHSHQLISFGKFITFICDFCGKEGKSMPYLCGSNCGFWAHLNCASLPRMVKCIRHKHPLNLANSIKDDHSELRVCQLCVKNVDKNHGVYYCSSCDYVAHPDCATDEKCIDANFMWESTESTNMMKYEDPELDELINELSYIVKKTKVVEDKIKIPIEIKHLYHEHDLQLIDELENYKICDGCVQPIFPPFYNYTQCNFILHKSCVELPHIKRHPLHQHPLTLKLKRPSRVYCDACSCISYGFNYSCDECNFYLDVPCSLISELDTLTHVGHKHLLIFSSTTNDECSACNSEGKVSRCSKCVFALDLGCATLPHTVKYRQHEHLFTLCYNAENDLDEYYCDICEEERDLKYWFYYCEECNYPAHPKCIFQESLDEWKDYRNIKFKSIYTSTVHQHPLTLVQKTKAVPRCDKCGQPCYYTSYACASCNISFHLRCV